MDYEVEFINEQGEIETDVLELAEPPKSCAELEQNWEYPKVIKWNKLKY